VPYVRLCKELGYGRGAATPQKKHVLRQHIRALKQVLENHRVACTIAVVPGYGYALCSLRMPNKRKKHRLH